MSKLHIPKHAIKLVLLMKQTWHVGRAIKSWVNKYHHEYDLCEALTDNKLMQCNMETETC